MSEKCVSLTKYSYAFVMLSTQLEFILIVHMTKYSLKMRWTRSQTCVRMCSILYTHKRCNGWMEVSNGYCNFKLVLAKGEKNWYRNQRNMKNWEFTYFSGSMIKGNMFMIFFLLASFARSFFFLTFILSVSLRYGIYLYLCA